MNDAPTAAHAAAPSDAELLLPTGWPDVLDVAPPDRRILVAVAGVAVATDVAVRSGIDGLGGVTVIIALAVAVLASRRLTNARAIPLVALAPVFGAGLGLWSAEWLLFLDLAAAAGLLVLGASFARVGDPFHQTVPSLLGRGLHTFVHGVLAPAFLVAGRRSIAEARPSGAFALVRGLLLALPVALVLGLLLSSADPVFASFLRLPDLSDVAVHGFLLACGAWAAAGLLRTASAAPFEGHPGGRRFLGAVEATTVLTGMVMVFTAFAASQVVTALGGADHVLRTEGLTYAEHARRGFFQLLAAAAITLAVLMALRASVREPSRRFTALSLAAVALTLVLVGVALRRLGLYEQVYGLTVLRLLAVLFAVWIGGVFALLGLSIAGVGRGRAWFVPAAIAFGLAGLLVVNVANPEAFIVRRNVERLAGTERFDAWTLGRLSDDAVPALVDALPSLPAGDAVRVLEAVCAGGRRPSGGFWAANASRAAAADARRSVCP